MIEIEKLYFTNKNRLDWKDVEVEIKNISGSVFNNEKISKEFNIDNKAIDELTHSRYNMKLKGKLRLIKANLLMYLEEIIKDMDNERWKEDIDTKHKNIAKNRWYRYDIHFNYPVRDEQGNYIDKQKYKATVVLRSAEDNKLYLYDNVDIKK